MSRVIVIGAGLAGLSCATRLARAGAKVTLLTKGIGGLQLGQGTIDLLGYDPERVTKPLAAVPGFVERQPEHPYAVIGPQRLASAFGYAKELLGELLVGEAESNFQLPTAVGAVRPTCLAQPSMVAGDVLTGGRLAIVGLRQLKDFHPQLVAENLARTRRPDGDLIEARAVSISVAARDGEVDSTGVTYARAFDTAAFRERVAKALAPQLQDGERVGLPAVLGLKDPTAWQDLAEKLGHPVFEIPLPPPGVPGMRLNEALLAKAKAAGVRVVNGSRTVSVNTNSSSVVSVSVATAGRATEFLADQFVLATGGFESGALELDSYGQVRESLLGLPLSVPSGALVTGDYWGADQPLFRVGVKVNAAMQPLDEHGEPVYANLYAIGGLLAGAARTTEKSGDGIALASAVCAADSIEEL